MSISLDKKISLVKDVLARRNVPENIKLQVKSCIDISGSMSSLFSNGTVQEVTDRLLAVAVRFDDNQSIESYCFGSDAAQLSDIKPAMFGKYIDNCFLPEAKKSGHLWSGTSYAKALKLIMKDGQGQSGFFGFGKKSKPDPTYLMFITDGDTYDEADSEKLLMEFDEQNTYVQLIGIGTGSSFGFIKRMADKYDHVGFVTFPSIELISDEDIYEKLLTEELATWIRGR